MSGVFGFYCHGINPEKSNKNLQYMELWNRAYGRDKKEMLILKEAGLGCCYEKLSKHASPSSLVFQIEGKHYLVDAIIYNRDKLIEKLSAASALSDEELLITYIRTYGLTSLADINGDFCGAIYDPTDGLTLFRDHMGIRPLYYYKDDSSIVFSTDIRGILALSELDLSINEDWLFRTISGYTSLSLTGTEFTHINCVPPAGYLQFSPQNGKIQKMEHSYWQLGRQKVHLSSEQAYSEQLRQLISDSVQRRLEAIPGTVGAELSGGLDSGVISILINRLNRECLYHSWSTDPKELPYAENDERFIVRDICEQEHITCHFSDLKLPLGESSMIAKNMQLIGMEYDEQTPTALRYVMTPSTNTLPICEASQYISRSGAKVIFSGHGGDEGVSHRSNPYEMFFAHEYYHYLRYMWSTTHGRKHRIYNTFKTCYKNIWENRAQYKAAFNNPFGAPELLSASFSAQFSEKDMPPLRFGYDPKGYINSGGSRNRLDVTAMLGTYSGVRYIFPYLDYRVIDYAVSIPRYLFLKGNRNRYIFREAFKDIMPPSLYKLKIKADNSLSNMKEDPDWFTKFNQDRIDIVNRLNREQWAKYLNFEIIDSWLQEGKPDAADRDNFENKYYCLFLCALLDNLIQQSKAIPQKYFSEHP